MHKSLFGIAAVVFAAGFFLRSLPASQAQDFGPIVTGGEAPWVDFTGSLGPSVSENIYQVPLDRVLVVTGFCGSSGEIDLQSNDGSTTQNRVLGPSNASNCHSGGNGYVGQGQAHIKFEPGDFVRLENRGSNATRYYVLQGYLAAP